MSEPVLETDSLIGQRIFGGYVVTRRIGEGGIGAVYAAENPDLNTRLAVKVLLPERSSNSTIAKRFMAEARAASAINHRNIIQVIDAGQLDSGLHYILMEHLEGETLARWGRRKGQVSIGDALIVMAQVCSGLEYAHLRGIIHRDLKPANLFVAPQPENPLFTKILDFGIAKLNDDSLAEGFQTRTEASAGTPNYMSPEQARALRDVDERTDIYALGVIAYELLTTKLPYKAHSIGELAYQHTSSMPPAPRQLRSDIPPAWNELIGRALSIEPMDRPGTARELAELMIAATPRGEEIAERVAPLLFRAPPDDPTKPLRIPPPPDIQVSITESIGDGEDMILASAPEASPRTTPTPASEPEPEPRPVASTTASTAPASRSWILPVAALLVLAGGIGAYVATRGDSEPAVTKPQPPPKQPPAQPIVVQPMAASTQLTVTTDPPGAFVFIDGLAADGTTPLTVAIDQGKQVQVKVTLAGFTDELRTVASMEDTQSLELSLTAADRPKPKRRPKPKAGPKSTPKHDPKPPPDPDNLFDTRK